MLKCPIPIERTGAQDPAVWSEFASSHIIWSCAVNVHVGICDWLSYSVSQVHNEGQSVLNRLE